MDAIDRLMNLCYRRENLKDIPTERLKAAVRALDDDDPEPLCKDENCPHHGRAHG